MKRYTLVILFIIAALVIAGCGFSLAGGAPKSPANTPTSKAPLANTSFAAAPAATVTPNPDQPLTGVVAALQATFEQIYNEVSPSVVTLQVVSQSSGSTLRSPFGFQGPQIQQGLGSGFVWDTQGHIVTNNHVVDGATQITVVFSDGSTAAATVVGTDPQSDLAVVKVNVPASQLKPVRMGDSNAVKVGQIAIAIGNPFGEQNTMTTGIISALGRFLPVDQNTTGPTYTIPDVIQTDAPINPGNSGGVLLNVQGEVIGVTSAIESPVRASAGIGFAIPAEVVKKVVPALISTGHFDHSYLGISGTDLTPDLAKAMGLPADQRGALVVDVTAGGPAAAAGIQGSKNTATINGRQVPVGGDVIIAIDGQPIKTFNDLVAYLAVSTEVGQKVNLTILRNGKQQTVTVTLGLRPATPPQASGQVVPFQSTPNQGQGAQPSPTGAAYLGIQGMDMNSSIAQAMNLPADQTGVLIVSVTRGTPAASAGLRGGSRSVTIGGQTFTVGGDVIIAFNGKTITGLQDLRSALSNAQPGQKVTLTILRNGRQMDISVTLGAATATQ